MTFKTLKHSTGNVGTLKDEITQLVSKEGEVVDLVETIFPLEYDGKVEEWLYELEKQMKFSIKKVIIEAIKDYPDNSRDFTGVNINSKTPLKTIDRT